jgi:heme-degrading monooxygenase HmoA
VKPGVEEEFLRRYSALAARVEEGLEGHVLHRLSRDLDDPERWAIESIWESLEAEEAWERMPEHRELTGAMRECWAEADRSRYTVHLEARRREPQ